LLFPQPLVYPQALVSQQPLPQPLVYPQPLVFPKPVVFAKGQNILSVPVQTEEFRMVRTDPVAFSPFAAEAAPKRSLLRAAGKSQ